MVKLDTQGKGRRLSSWKEKIYKEKVVFNIKKNLAYFSLVLPLYRNRTIDLLCKSVDWFLYNGNTGLNGKVDVWLMKTVKINMLIFRYMFLFSEATPFFISISVAYGKIMISASKVAKKLLSVIFKSSLIITWHLSLRAVFYWYYDVIFRDGIVSSINVELNWIYFST